MQSRMPRKLDILLRRNWRQAHLLMALVTDSLSLWGAAIIAFWVRRRFGPAPTLTPEAFLDSVLICWSLFIFFASILGLYRAAYHVPTRDQRAIGLRAYFLTIPFFLSLLYLLHWDAFPRGFVIVYLIFIPLIFLSVRGIMAGINTIIQKAGVGVYNAVIIGFNGTGKEIIEAYDKMPQLGCRITAIIDKGTRSSEHGDSASRVPHYPYSRLKEVIEQDEISRVLVPSIDDAAAFPEIVETCRDLNLDLKVLTPDFEGMWRYSFVHDIAGIPLYVRRRRRTEWFKTVSKRIFDIAGSIVGLILTAPLLLLAACAIVVEDGFPVFFRQKRALAKGKVQIEVVKFRSMKKGTEHYHTELLKRNKTSGGLLFVEDDPRITRVGRILRRFSIDELPQLFKVLKGDMSLVGPRPLDIRDLENIAPENTIGGFYALRSRAKAGMSGLWQISGRREVNFKEMVLLDLYYIENQTIMFDIEILFGTVPVVLFGKGAY